MATIARLLDTTNDPEEDRTLPRFVMDFSLFRVAKHLRLLGYDTICDPRLPHGELLPCAAQQRRILISGSRTLEQQVSRRNRIAARTRLASRSQPETAANNNKRVVAYNSDGESVYMSSSDDDAAHDVVSVHIRSSGKHDETLVYIMQQLSLSWDTRRLFTRCVSCNRLIKPIDKSEVEPLVHPTVFRVYSCFYQCPECKKVYWGVDNGVVVNFKALRTIEYLQRYCLQEGIRGADSAEGRIQRHFLSFPRVVKCTIFSFLTNEELDTLLIVLPMMSELIGIIRSGGSVKFVPDRKMRKGKNYNECPPSQ